jgi:hypothetical protein
MATKLLDIANIRRNELAVIGEYRTKENSPYDRNNTYVKSDGDKYGKDPVNINDSDNYNKVGDLADIKARIGVDSPGNLLKNIYTRDGNQYDIGDVLPLPV